MPRFLCPEEVAAMVATGEPSACFSIGICYLAIVLLHISECRQSWRMRLVVVFYLLIAATYFGMAYTAQISSPTAQIAPSGSFDADPQLPLQPYA